MILTEKRLAASGENAKGLPADSNLELILWTRRAWHVEL